MGLFTTVSAPDSAGKMTRWQFKHGMDQCQHYELHEAFGWEVQHNHGEYDCDGVYLGLTGPVGNRYEAAVVVVKGNCVVAVYPVKDDSVEVMTPVAEQMAERHGVTFDYDEFWF